MARYLSVQYKLGVPGTPPMCRKITMDVNRPKLGLLEKSKNFEVRCKQCHLDLPNKVNHPVLTDSKQLKFANEIAYSLTILKACGSPDIDASFPTRGNIRIVGCPCAIFKTSSILADIGAQP